MASAPSRNPCPICTRPKTAWSRLCQRCEGNRQRYLVSLERAEADEQFLRRLDTPGVTLQAIADELGVKRQRVFQLKQDAIRRVSYLKAHPAPRRAFEQASA